MAEAKARLTQLFPLPPSPPPGLATCTDCDPGFYSTQIGSTSACTYCPTGKYTDGSGSTTCKDCPAGRYGNTIAEIRAEPGNECAGPCPVGSYSRPGALECKLCPEGRYGDVAGSGVVGFTALVCTGACRGADPGSTCCPRWVFFFFLHRVLQSSWNWSSCNTTTR